MFFKKGGLSQLTWKDMRLKFNLCFQGSQMPAFSDCRNSVSTCFSWVSTMTTIIRKCMRWVCGFLASINRFYLFKTLCLFVKKRIQTLQFHSTSLHLMLISDQVLELPRPMVIFCRQGHRRWAVLFIRVYLQCNPLAMARFPMHGNSYITNQELVELSKHFSAPLRKCNKIEHLCVSKYCCAKLCDSLVGRESFSWNYGDS